MPTWLKDFLFHKLTLRLIYIGAAYATSHFVALAASPRVTQFLVDSGIQFKVIDPMKFKAHITMLMLIGGEFVYHFVHEKFILPNVQTVSAPPPPPTIKPA